MISPVKVVRKQKREKKPKQNCFNCLESSKAETPGYVYCFRWKVVVSCGRAKICPDYAPPVKRGGRKRRGGEKV
ncbi:hypothetical protein Ferp_2045 [Ferroglobus placidus DSM 10642]|uniref:Uncharacterized protein n=1 Tax=Ferroglobus placidus (strain DSM 10642 / AEDII12DO) TaxID=589924 RepID=D3S0B6_FERPA|nr:hypothetical protein Ferp_2045 [Ferroglobus placidus DSM 10642]